MVRPYILRRIKSEVLKLPPKVSESGSVLAWCDLVWCGVVRCGVVWCGAVWCGMVCFRLLWVEVRYSVRCGSDGTSSAGVSTLRDFA
jgi:hypothetical protein